MSKAPVGFAARRAWQEQRQEQARQEAVVELAARKAKRKPRESVLQVNDRLMQTAVEQERERRNR